MTPVAPARLAAWAGSHVRTRSRGVAKVDAATAPRLIALAREHAGFITLSAVAIAFLLVLTQQASFWADEWTYIRQRSFTDPASWFLPHAEHFVALHALVYTGLLAVFGTSAYLPFLLVLFAAHLAFVAAVYVLVDRHVGRGPALAVAAVLLVLGSAALNLFWAFQMGAIASGALAMWAIVVIRTRPALAGVLLALGIATQGFALFFVPAAALYGWSRKAFAACLAPVAVYGVWYVVARDAMYDYPKDPLSLVNVASWIRGGFEASAAAVTGLSTLGVVLFAGAVVLVARVKDRRLAAMGIIGLLTEYALLGISRPGLNTPSGWQYIYFGAAFAALVFAAAWPAIPRWGRPATAMLAVTAVASNALSLVSWTLYLPTFMAQTDALCRFCVGS